MADWADLDMELDLWAQAGQQPRLWWRDDDAQAPTPALDRLLSIATRHGVPVHLSVIPQGLSPALAERLRGTGVRVLQHGLAHVNHARPGSPASEFAPPRPLERQEADLKEGWRILSQAGFEQLLPGLVPPWNRIDDDIRRRLPDLGYRYLSTYDGRGDETPLPGLNHLNAHLDPIRWKQDRVFRGSDKMLDMLIAHLHQRRTNTPDRPIGYVTHHLQTSDAVWAFTDALLARTSAFWRALPEMEEPPENG